MSPPHSCDGQAELPPALAAALRFDAQGLVTAVAQDEGGAVLMVAHMDREALATTLRTGEVHYHSRSRSRLWRKGETSGHVQRLRALSVDCDGDALLLTVGQAGPACHLGTRSCFARRLEGEALKDDLGL